MDEYELVGMDSRKYSETTSKILKPHLFQLFLQSLLCSRFCIVFKPETVLSLTSIGTLFAFVLFMVVFLVILDKMPTNRHQNLEYLI
jgi:hypothetical protein